MRWRTLLGAWPVAALLLLGLSWRATFIDQGYAATDEGFLQSFGARIAAGDVPYRDFNAGIPPLSFYKEAALLTVLGGHYTILAGRWVFALEATLGSICAYLVLRTITARRAAFAWAAPTIFFSVLLYYFPNYTYDGEVLLVASLAALVRARRRWSGWGVAAGVLAAGGCLAKTNFVAWVPLVIGVALLASRWRGSGRPSLPGLEAWPAFAAAFGAVAAAYFAYFASLGAAGSMLAQWSAAARGAAPASPGFLLWQDLPDYLGRADVMALALAVVAGGFVIGRGQRLLATWGALLLLAALGAALLLTADPSVYGVIERGNSPRPMLLLLGLDLTLLLPAAGIVLAAVGPAAGWEIHRRLPPIELMVLALGLQYLAQFAYAGAIFFYVGAWLTLPVSLQVLAAAARAGSNDVQRLAAAGAVGAWFVAGSAAVIHLTVYEDGPRYSLTETFAAPRLAGVWSRPANVEEVDAVVAAVNAKSRPGDPVLVMPDYPGIYYLTGRTNPTRTMWFNPSVMTPQVGADAVKALAARPPRVVLLQHHRAWDVARQLTPVDYEGNPGWAPIYLWITAHYRPAGEAGDLAIMVPR